MKSRKFLAKLLGLSMIVSSALSTGNVVFAATGDLENTILVGSSEVVGTESLDGDKLVISAEGGKMQSADDNINFSYVPVEGDFTATMKIESLEDTSSNTRAYLMVRNGLDTTSAHISAGVKSSGQGAYELRLPSRKSGSLSGSEVGAYVRIVKEGSTYSIYVSDSLQFGEAVKTFADTESLEADTLNVGIAVCSATVTVDYFNVVDANGNTVYDLQGEGGSTEETPDVEATITEITMPSAITVSEGETVNLPSTVTATLSDGTQKQVAVTWGSVSNEVGTQTVSGTVEGYTGSVSISVTILEKEETPDEDVPEVYLSTIYVAPNASDSGAGTASAPMSITKAIETVEAGGVIYLQGGTYSFDEQLTISHTNNGEAGKVKTMVAVDGAEVIFDFSAQSYNMSDTSVNERGLQLDGSYWHIKDITVQGAADNGFFISGKNNTIEHCVARANRDTGIQISRRNSSLTAFEDWPSDNLILNCTSYNNSDPATGENADGFAAKLTCGEGNVFDGCIAYNNVDDGWDLYAKESHGPIGAVTIRNSIAFRNGATTEGQFTEKSDGNGFKLGGSKIAVSHVVENCIAFENKNHGFTDNSNPGVITVRNCTSINNALDGGSKSNFDFARDKTNSYNILENCISFSEGKVGSDKYIGEAENCVFYNGGKWYNITDRQAVNTNDSSAKGTQITGPTADDFETLETPAIGTDIHTLWRNADGSINIGNVFKIKATSDFANRNLGADLSN